MSDRNRVSAIFVLALWVAAVGVAADAVKLSQGQSFSEVFSFDISPDGSLVAYNSNADIATAADLWLVSSNGGTPLRLSDPLPSGFSASSIRFSPDGGRVIYVVNEFGLRKELHSVSVDGLHTVQLNASLPPPRSVGRFQISPDGAWVVFNAASSDLYSIPIAGGDLVKLNTVPGTYRAFDFMISPDSVHVVFTAAWGDPNRERLYSVLISGGKPNGLSPSVVDMTRNVSISRAAISPDGAQVVFRSDHETEGLLELYSVPILGGGLVKLHPDLVDGQRVFPQQISLDSSRVVYISNLDSEDINELYSVPITGGDSLNLNSHLVEGGDVSTALISPDSSRVVYLADQQIDERFELYSVPITGGSVVKLNSTPVAGGDVGPDFVIAPDGSTVIYRADQDFNDWVRGYRAPLSGPSGNDEGLWFGPFNVAAVPVFEIFPTGRHVVVSGVAIFADSIERLWLHPIVGTPDPAGIELISSDDFHPDGDVSEFAVGANGTIVYIADQDTDERFELYAIPLVFTDGFESGDTSSWSSSVP